ncbi:MAG: hypothetical protein QXJ48_05550 [Candidatus Korarchaeum sp.]
MVALPSVTIAIASPTCVEADYESYREQMKPGESGYLAQVYVRNTCSQPINLILKLITVDREPSNDVEVPVYLNPGEGKTQRLRTFVPLDYEDKVLPFYVEVYQNLGNAYVPVLTLKKLSTVVFPDFSIVVYSYNETVSAGEKILAGISASTEAVNSLYDAVASLISGGRTKIQVVKVNLYPNRETKFYVDVPKDMRPGEYKLHFEIYKRKYKLAESNLLVDPAVTILPAVTVTRTEVSTTPTTSVITTSEVGHTIEVTRESTTSPQATVSSEAPTPGEKMLLIAIALMILALAVLAVSVILLLRRRAA